MWVLFLILFPLAVFGQNELTFAVKEQEEHPYVVPIIGADEFASWLTSDPDLAKFVLFTVDERWCHICRRIICPFNEVASNILENTADFCQPDLETYEARWTHKYQRNMCLHTEKSHFTLHDLSNCAYNYSVFMPYFGFFDLSNYDGNLKDIDTSVGWVKFAVVKDVTPEFMEKYMIPGLPFIRLYKPNGEMIDYMGSKMFRRPYLAIMLRVFLGVNLWNEPINQPCMNFQAMDNGPPTDDWLYAPEGKVFPGSFGRYCDHMKDQLIKQYLTGDRKKIGMRYMRGWVTRDGTQGWSDSDDKNSLARDMEYWLYSYPHEGPGGHVFKEPIVKEFHKRWDHTTDSKETLMWHNGHVIPYSYADFDYLTFDDWHENGRVEPVEWYTQQFKLPMVWSNRLQHPEADKYDPKKALRNLDFEYVKAEIEKWDPEQFT